MYTSCFSFDEEVYVRHVTGFVNVARLHGREEGVTFQNKVSSFRKFSNGYKNIWTMLQVDNNNIWNMYQIGCKDIWNLFQVGNKNIWNMFQVGYKNLWNMFQVGNKNLWNMFQVGYKNIWNVFQVGNKNLWNMLQVGNKNTRKMCLLKAFYKKKCFEKFRKFTGKHQCRSPFLLKESLFYKKETPV